MDEQQNSLAAFLDKLLLRAQRRVEIMEQADGNAFAVVPKGYELQELDDFLEYPRRVRQTVTLAKLEDFIAYVNRFRNIYSTCFVNPELESLGSDTPLVTCIIDYHQENTLDQELLRPRWGVHSALFRAKMAPCYKRLLDLCNPQLIQQSDFSNQLRDVLGYCTAPLAADMLETARSLRLTSSGSFKSFNEERSGSVEFDFTVKVSATTDATRSSRLTIPEALHWRMPMILGGEPVEFTTEFRYRTPEAEGRQVRLGLHFAERAEVEAREIQRIVDQLRAETGLMVLVGALPY